MWVSYCKQATSHLGVRSHWLRFTPLAIRALCVATLLRFLPAESRPKSFVDILDLRVIFLEIFLQRVLGCAIVTYPGRLFHTDPRVELEESFEYWNRRLQAHPEPWRIVVVYWGCTLLCQGTGLEVSHPDQLGSRSNEDRSYQKSVHARLELPCSQGGEPVEVECPTAQ